MKYMVYYNWSTTKYKSIMSNRHYFGIRPELVIWATYKKREIQTC